MARPPQPTLVFAPGVKPNKCIVVNYQCPPDPNLINYILEILVNIAQLYVRTDTTRALSTHDYISQSTKTIFENFVRNKKSERTVQRNLFKVLKGNRPYGISPKFREREERS